MINMKNIVRADMRISIMLAFVWGTLIPIKAQMQGLLTVETIGLFVLMVALVMETMTILTRLTTFKSSTLLIISYDVIFIVALFISLLTLNDKELIFVILFAMIPYGVLAKNAGNKFKVMLGEQYPPRVTEKVYVRLNIIENRSMLIATGLTSLLASHGLNAKELLMFFVFISVIQSTVSFSNYFKYYKHLK